MLSISMSLEKIHLDVFEKQIVLAPQDNPKKFLRHWRLNSDGALEKSITYEKHQEINKLYQVHRLELKILGFAIEKNLDNYILKSESEIDKQMMESLLKLFQKIHAISAVKADSFNEEFAPPKAQVSSPISSNDEEDEAYYADTSDNENLEESFFSTSPYGEEQKIHLLFKTFKPVYNGTEVTKVSKTELLLFK